MRHLPFRPEGSIADSLQVGPYIFTLYVGPCTRIELYLFRHLSVCRSCFQHVDKCPVCRAPYDQYMTVQRDREKQNVLRVPRLPRAAEEEKSPGLSLR